MWVLFTMYPAYEYILLYNVKQKGEERKGKSHMPFKAINIFILMHKHNKPKWYVGGGDMLAWLWTIYSIEMNYGHVATSLKIVSLKGNWLKTILFM